MEIEEIFIDTLYLTYLKYIQNKSYVIEIISDTVKLMYDV